jgi:hypothetical protein
MRARPVATPLRAPVASLVPAALAERGAVMHPVGDILPPPMTATAHHLAQINVARALAPLDDPLLADFVAQLDLVNAAAERSEGFVWRLASDEGGPSSYVRAYDDPRMVVNLTVWTSVEAVKAYAYRNAEHAAVFRARRQWFEHLDGPSLALWWIPAGTLPTAEEGKAKLELLARLGPTPDAFTFKAPFPPPLASELDASRRTTDAR